MRSIPAQIKSYAPGFALALVIALLAKGIEALLPFDVIGASVIAMFIGMLINGYRKPGKTTAPGVKFTAKKILKFAIILLGASLNVTTILNVGRMSLTVMLFTLLTCFGGGYFIGRALGLDWKLYGPCLALGLSPFIMQSTEGVISVCFNASLQRYGGDLAVGAMTILASVMQFSMLPLQGLTQGAQPIISYNFGAKNARRVKSAFRLLLICCLSYSALLWLLAMVFPGTLASIFATDKTLISYSAWAMRIYMAASVIFGAQIACQQTFIALGNAKTSLFLAVLRKIILLIPLILILPLLFRTGEEKVMAVFLAEPVADTLAVLTTVCTFAYQFRKTMKDLEETA